MLKKRVFLAALATVLILVSGCGGDRVVGTVGGKELRETDVDRRVAIGSLLMPELDVSQVPRAGVVDQLLEEEMLLTEAENQGITIEPEKVKAAWEELYAGLMAQYGDAEKLEAALKKAGITESDLKKVLADNLKLAELYQKVTADVKVSADEAEQYYRENLAEFEVPEQVKASHILVAEEKLAEEIRSRLLKGEDFAELAREYSIDPGSKETGGELGYFSRGQMVPEFDQAAFDTPVGELSPVVKSSFGFHIIKVEDKKPARTLSFAEVEEVLTKHLEDQRKADKFAAFMADLKEKLKPQNKLQPSAS
ncbi:MAG: hypothetical protein PWP12_629 [Bacillota bacterium]|nr:hypothetical protein [Bacillota bacterium]MDK2881869.1 hypothetical protein [Bacillota bacterium]MDK2960445.1 hypothetical protein [Bacillota bacterium]